MYNVLQSVNSESLHDDKEIRKFFHTLVKSHLDTTGSLSRIDLLSCPVAQSAEGKNLVEELSQLVEVCLSVSLYMCLYLYCVLVMCSFVCVCLSVCLSVCICVCVCLSVCVCICASVCSLLQSRYCRYRCILVVTYLGLLYPQLMTAGML